MSGVVLAGGASRRMGVDKATLPHPSCPCRGTLLDHALHVLADAGAAPVLVATGTPGRLGPARPPASQEVGDDEEHRGAGPLAGILAALRRSPVDVVAVVAVDLPDADAELLRWLRRQWRDDDVALVPLDPSGAAGGTLTLNVRRRPAPSNPTNAAVIGLAGGPGQAAIPFAAKIAQDGQGFRAASEFSIDRNDFNIKYPEMSDDLIRNDVVIKLDIRV